MVFDYKEHHPINTEDGSVWWIVYDGKKPVAYAGASYLKEKNRVYLCRVGVLDEYRGLGLQKELIKKRLQWAKTCGADAAVTYTDGDNIYSSNNLIKSGFLLYIPDFPWGSSPDALYWVKKL
jgi:GNAT superfamily N-acetyltransferase